MFPPNFPAEYSWLKDIGLLPKVLQEAIPLYGTAEVIGKGSSKTILSWRDMLNQNGVKISGYSDDSVPWCGLFAAYVTFKAGKTVVADPLWALNWASSGIRSRGAAVMASFRAWRAARLRWAMCWSTSGRAADT